MTAIGFLVLHHLDLLLLAIPLRALYLVAGAVWEGARPEVVSFSEDVVSVVFDRLRRRVGLPTTRAVGSSYHRRHGRARTQPRRRSDHP